jgi:hypothetical protein
MREVKMMVRKPKVKRAYRTLAMPKDVRAWVKKKSRRTGASENSEIVRCIRDRMDAERRERA